MTVKEIKTIEEKIKFYNQEYKKIAEMNATNEVKANLLNQLNRTVNIYG